MRYVTYITLLAALTCAGSSVAQAPELDQKRVTLEADATSLADVFADLSEQTGVGVILKGADNIRATLALTNVLFADCMDALADMFSLLVVWEDDALVVQSLDDALAEADKLLARGRTEAIARLGALGDGTQAMYGSEKLRERVSEALRQFIEERTRSVLGNPQPQPALARALASLDLQDPQLRVPLAAVAVRGLSREGQTDEALALWDGFLQGENTPEAIVAWGELLLALHYSRSPKTAEFWSNSFVLFNAALVLHEGWRQGRYLEALHFARLNRQYAAACGRAQEAQALQSAIDACLGAPRVIQVTCAVDSEATTDPRCEAKIRARVAKCSEVFGQSFGIQFAIAEMIRWNPPSDNDFGRQYAALKAALGNRKAELTIGFILEVFQMHPGEFNPAHRHLWTGYGCPHMGAYLLTRDFAFEDVNDLAASEWTFSSGAVAETLVHEMGHMFGALHVDDNTSVMRPSSKSKPTFQFDAVNARVIKREKWKDFSRGVESLDEPELLGLVADYRELARMFSRPNGAQEEEARVHLALGKLYRQRWDPVRAVEQLKQVLAIGAPSEIVGEAKRMLAGG